MALSSKGALCRGMLRVPIARCNSRLLFNSIGPREFCNLSFVPAATFFSSASKTYTDIESQFLWSQYRASSNRETDSVSASIFVVINPGSHEEAERKGLVTRKLFASYFPLCCTLSSTALFILFVGELKGVKIGRLFAVQF